jgi:hypothetical protein
MFQHTVYLHTSSPIYFASYVNARLFALHKFTILVTYYFALAIGTDAMIDFGLQGYKLGLFLLLFDLSILFLSIWLAWSSYRKQLKHAKIREHKVVYTTQLYNAIQLCVIFNSPSFTYKNHIFPLFNPPSPLVVCVHTCRRSLMNMRLASVRTSSTLRLNLSGCTASPRRTLSCSITPITNQPSRHANVVLLFLPLLHHHHHLPI